MAVNPITAISTLTAIQDGIGNFVAGPEPANPVAAAIQRRYRAQCDSYSNAPSWFQGLVEASNNGGATMDNICGPWLESQGSGPPDYAPVFEGGQCPGVAYNWSVSYERSTRFNADGSCNFSARSDSGTATGPLTAAYNDFEVSPGSTDCDNGQYFSWALRSGSGSLVAGEFNAGGARSYRNFSWTITRADGLPDDCGDQPPSVIEPNPNPRPDPGLDPSEEPQPGPTGDPVFPMPDLPNPFGDPIPLPDFGSPFPFNAPLDGGGGQPYAPPPPEPGPEGPIPGDNKDENGDNDFGDPPEGERWVGCSVDQVIEPIGVGSIPSAEPDRIYPSVVGNARLVFGNGTRELDTPIQIRSRRVFLWEGIEGCNPTGCRVNVAPGFSYEVTPFSVPVEPERPPDIV